MRTTKLTELAIEVENLEEGYHDKSWMLKVESTAMERVCNYLLMQDEVQGERTPLPGSTNAEAAAQGGGTLMICRWIKMLRIL